MSSASLQLGGDNWAAKDGNLLGYQRSSSSSVHIPHEFTFTRGSDIAATRINSSGLIEKGRENLLLQSNQFDTTWTLNATSVTSGQAGYDGSNDAWLLNSTTTGFPRIEQSVTSSGVATYSVYVKPATDGFINMRTFGTDAAVWFNLNDGVVVNASGSQYVSSKVESVGDGWYRCSVIVNGSLTTVRIYPASSYGLYSTSGNGVYIQDAQLEVGMVATDYIETGASTVKAGILENTPRLDYSGGATEPSLLLEPQRTNYLPYSEYIQGIQTNLSYDYNDVASPENVDNGATLKLAADSSAVRHRQLFSLSTTDGTDYTFSVFFKKADANWIQLMGAGASSVFTTSMWANFDLENGVVGNKGTELIDSGIEDYGNGWYRCYISAQAEATATGYFEILTTNNTDSGRYPSYQNSTALDYVHIYGAQVEEGSYPTSYIPTYGTSDTRAADDCGGAGTSSTFNDTEGVLFIDLETSKNASPAQIAINDGTYDNRIIFEVRPDAASIKALINSSGTNVYDVSVSASPNTAYKVAIKYSANDIAFFVDGVKETSTTTTTAMPTGLSDLSFTGKENDGALRFIGDVKQTLVFKTALTDRELVDLTSPYSTYQELVTAEGLTWESPTCTTNSITELQSI